MLKLKDIFNIDLNSKGGGKLYKKIMRKYNIPLKDTKEVKQEIVECSSGGSNARIEVCYYKRIENSDYNKQYDNGIAMLCRLVNVIDPIYNKGNVLIYNNIHPMSGEEILLSERLSVCVGFCMIKEETPLMQAGGQYILVPKGNLMDKFNFFIDNFQSDEPEIIESFKQLLNYINNTYQEITKEEYEAMITYKP